MSTIKVTPEQLHHVSNQVDQARQQLESIRSDLTRQIMFVQMMWMGATQERFYYEFEQSRPILDKALESMVNTSKELKDIATRFQDADAQKGSLGGAFGAVGAAVMMTKSTGASGLGDKGYRMAYNAMLGKMMPVNEKGVTDQAALQAYERDQGHLDLNRMQAVNVEPPGEDIFALQIKAFERGIHPTTGEPVSDKYAQMMVTSLKFSQIFMGIQMVRGSMPGGKGPFRLPSSNPAVAKIKKHIEKAESEAKLVNKPAERATEGTPNSPIVGDLSRAQQRNLTTLDNIVDKHLTEMDFSGTLRDLQGNPVPNKKTGGYWNHLQEMQDSYKGLSKIKRGLEGSLQNPNLSPSLKSTLEGALDKANTNLKKIEDLFEPFGGIK